MSKKYDNKFFFREFARIVTKTKQRSSSTAAVKRPGASSRRYVFTTKAPVHLERETGESCICLSIIVVQHMSIFVVHTLSHTHTHTHARTYTHTHTNLLRTCIRSCRTRQTCRYRSHYCITLAKPNDSNDTSLYWVTALALALALSLSLSRARALSLSICVCTYVSPSLPLSEP